MRSPLRQSRPTARAVAIYGTLALGTFVVAQLLRYPSLYEPRWYGDEGIFAAVAENMRHGRTLYAQAWDNKPPLIYFTYAAIQSAFGTSVFALHLVSTVTVIATQAIVMAIALLLFGARRALVAGLIFALALATPIIEGNLAMTESFMILPTSLAVLLFVLAEWRGGRASLYHVVIGMLAGIATAYKQVAVFDGAAIAVMIWLTHERPFRALALIAAGFAVPQIALAALFLATGAFPQYWYAVVGSLGLYSELGPAVGPLARFAGYLPALFVVRWLVRRRQRGEIVALESFPLLWLGFAVAGVTSSTFPFPHYLQQAVPAFALVLVADPFAYERDDLSRLLLAVTGVLVMAVALGQFSPAYRERSQLAPMRYYRTFAEHEWGGMNDLEYDYHFDGKAVAVRDIVRYINQDGAGTTVYAWSELPWLYAAGGLTNPTRFYTSFLGEVLPGAKREILDDLEARPPAYAVISTDTYAPFAGLERWVVRVATRSRRLAALPALVGERPPRAAMIERLGHARSPIDRQDSCMRRRHPLL